jgi:hypothetical protein
MTDSIQFHLLFDAPVDVTDARNRHKPSAAE